VAHPEQSRLAARGVLARHEAQPCGKLPALFEMRRITDCCD
jgi:hypothetical protein